jgi:hypothetical protein
MAAGKFQIATPLNFLSAVETLELVSPIAMIFRLRFRDVDDDMILEVASSAEPLSAATGTLVQFHVMMVDLVGPHLVQVWRVTKHTAVFAKPSPTPVLLLFPGLPIGLGLVALLFSTTQLRLQLRNPGLQLSIFPSQLGQLLPYYRDLIHDVANFVEIPFSAKSNLLNSYISVGLQRFPRTGRNESGDC